MLLNALSDYPWKARPDTKALPSRKRPHMLFPSYPISFSKSLIHVHDIANAACRMEVLTRTEAGCGSWAASRLRARPPAWFSTSRWCRLEKALMAARTDARLRARSRLLCASSLRPLTRACKADTPKKDLAASPRSFVIPMGIAMSLELQYLAMVAPPKLLGSSGTEVLRF